MMVPKLHAKGSSFKGAAVYLLHDKGRAETDERVAWTETRNLAIDDPEIAWRIMASTAMDQERLKQQAGVKNTGRKSDKHVLHFTLSWHPDQDPSREEMVMAADEAIAALGASDRQSMIIAHDDEKHPHLHVMCNRVSPIDGRHLPSSKEKLKLSQWAQDYEERTGIYCENRRINNAMRQGGEYVRGEKDKARHIHEDHAKAAANDNARTKIIAAEQRRKDAALSQRGRNEAEQQKGDWDKLGRAHNERKAALARDLQTKINRAKHDVREEYRPKWASLFRTQESERDTFAALERSFFGRAGNIVKTVRLSADLIREERSKIITRTFSILTNASARKEYFEKAQERTRMALQREQALRVMEAAQDLKAAQAAKFARNRTVYAEQRDNLVLTHEAQKKRLQQAWQQRSLERQQAYATVQPTQDRRRAPRKAPVEGSGKYVKAFEQAKQAKAKEQDNTQSVDDNSGTATGGASGNAGGMDALKQRAKDHLARRLAQRQDRGLSHDDD